MKQFLLCTDLDRTLIPNGAQTASPKAHSHFKKLAGQITLAYVTGRDLALVEQAITEFDLPFPDFVIADVGSTIYQFNSGRWLQWDEWDIQIAPDWLGLSHDELSRTLSVFPVLKLQEASKQNRHKLSFYVPLNIDTKKLISAMEAQFQFSGVKANLIWSIDENAGIGLLDILPVSANKLHAIRFVMQQKRFLHKNTVFCGDSGNDLDVLLSDIPSVLVANADEEVKTRAAHHDALYFARGEFLGMNGNYSAGILEGAAHYWPEVDRWIRDTGSEDNN